MFFCIFYAFAASFSTFIDDIKSLQHSQATFGTEFVSKYFRKTYTGHCPSGITIVELPLARWRSAAMAVIHIHAASFFATFSGNFWFQIKEIP